MSTRRAARCAAAIATLATALATLAGCSRSHEQGPPSTGAAPHAAILVRGGGPEPDSLDPQKARGFEAQSILRDLCEGLTTLDRTASVAPGVASTWGVSTDGRVYVFKLRREARWSNGDPVVAADFVAGLRRLVDPATASGYAQYIDVIANAGDIVAGRKPPQALGVAAPDDSTVVVTLATPAPYLPTLLSHPSACPVHRPTLAAHPEGLARPGVMLSNGAFVLQEWVPGSYILARRNPYYWSSSPPTTTASTSDARRSGTNPSCAGRCRWSSTASCSRSGCCGWASCPPGGGCRRVSTTTARSPSTIGANRWRRAWPRRSACTAKPATRASSRSPSSCATTPAKCTPSSRSRSPPCGRRPSAPTCA
ncbi:MAG: hypothetical protein E6K35_09995 [Gammaproteobacteria bacterium]|nr:MAG: hypothetical protein E6K35_09995 [Gammaproteobacteria bacterium]